MDKTQRTATLTGGKGKGLLSSILPAFFVSFLFGGVLLLLASFLLMQTADPTAYVRILGFVTPAVCVFFGGFMAGKREKNMGAFVGLINGVFFVLVLWGLSVFCGGTLSPAVRIVCYGLLLLLSTLGGLGGSVGGKRKSYRHGRRK